MTITDGKKTVVITMHVWKNDYMSQDCSIDFFEAGGLLYDDQTDTYTVADVDYCIEQAEDWMNQRGDFCADCLSGTEERFVFVVDARKEG